MGISQRLTTRQVRPYLTFGALALLVLAPLLRPGYILTLDMVFTPRLRLPGTVSSGYIFEATLWALNRMVPSQVIQKILLLGILFLCGLGMFWLVQAIRPSQHVAAHVGAYAGGALYTINPFTYSRFMAGQYSVLLGYALLPFFARAWLAFLAAPTPRRVLSAALWVVLISIVSVHTLGAVGILAVVGLGAAIWRFRRNKPQLQALGKCAVLGLLLVALASSYWLIPLALGRGSTARAVQNFSAVDRQAFATEGGHAIGQLANIARLQGFWVEGQGLYALPQDRVPAWGLLVLMVWIIIGIGAWQLWRSGRRFVSALLGGSAVMAALLATSGVNNWLAGWVPLFAGFREPHKFVSLVALAWAVYAGLGTAHLAERYQKKYGRLGLCGVAIAGAALVIAITSPMFWGFNGQLRPRQYPHDWFVINQQLRQDSDPCQTLFLPWHLYTQFSFSGRTIASPAPDFFDVPIVASNDPEYAGVKPALPDKTVQKVGEILAEAPRRGDLAAQLAAHDVKYILLSNDSDAKDYEYLNHQKDLRLLQDTPSLKLYKNEAIID